MLANTGARNMMKDVKKGISFEVISGVLFGTLGMWGKLLSNYNISFIHVTLLFSLSFIIINGAYISIFNRKLFEINKKQLLLAAVLGAIVMNGLKLCFFYAATVLPVGICASLQFCMVFPMMVVSKILFGERITIAKVLCGVFSALGVCLAFNVFSQNASYPLVGVLALLGSITFAVFQTTIFNVLIRDGLDGITIAFYFSIFGFISLFMASSPVDMSQIIVSSESILACIGFSLSNVLCIVFYVNGLKYIEPIQVGIVQAFDPITATVLGVIVFRDVLAVSQFIGIGIIIICVVGVSICDKDDSNGTIKLVNN